MQISSMWLMTKLVIFGKFVVDQIRTCMNAFSAPHASSPTRVLIASKHPIFAEGLRNLLLDHQSTPVEVLGVVSGMDETKQALKVLNPDLIIIDYDDDRLNREEFLIHFVEGEKKLRVVLLSLQQGKEAVIYDRRTMSATRIDEWLDDWSTSNWKTPPEEANRDRTIQPAGDEP
jgi:hypothetical protein